MTLEWLNWCWNDRDGNPSIPASFRVGWPRNDFLVIPGSVLSFRDENEWTGVRMFPYREAESKKTTNKFPMPSPRKPAFTDNSLRQPTNFKSVQKPYFEQITIYQNLLKLVNIKSLALKCSFCSSLCSHETMICLISEEKTTIEYHTRVIWIERQERAGISGCLLYTSDAADE